MSFKIKRSDYKKLVDKKVPSSKLSVNFFKAYISGGIICIVGQLIYDFYKGIGITPENCSLYTTISMIFAGALLTGLDIYPKIAKYAGAGSLVPVTGFANAVSAPAIESKTEGFITGVGAKIFSIAGPVILYGTIASFIAGIIFYFYI